ncbi:MAG: efflux transporter outer membrane subunit [Gemmatimonadales bacterium]
MPKEVALLALLLIGCASAPAYQEPALEIPTAFRETVDSLTAAPAPAPPAAVPVVAGDSVGLRGQYWRVLGDSTLDRLLGQALGGNLDVEAAQARIRGARAARLNATLDLAPTVTVGGSYTRQRLSSAGFPIGVGSFPDQDVWDAGFDATWELDLFGRVRRGVQAQGALVGAAQEELRDVRVSLSAELARVYFELRGAQGRLAVAQRNGENQRRTLELTRQRLDAGRGTAFDTERAQAQLNFTLASIPAFEAQVAAAQYRIGVLIGRPPTAVAQELQAVAPMPPLPASVTVASPDSLIRRRPDVAAAERRVAAERAFVGAAKAEYLPRLSLDGSAGLAATTFDSLGDRGTFRYAVGPVISWPALNLGRVKARVDASRALEAEARAQYHQTVLRALEEVETTLVRYRTSRGRVERIQDAAAASGRAAELARLRFTEGVADFLQVLDAERTQLEAEDQLALSRTEAATAYAALYKALGGDWSAAGEEDR